MPWLLIIIFGITGIFWIKELYKPTMTLNGLSLRNWGAVIIGMMIIGGIIQLFQGKL